MSAITSHPLFGVTLTVAAYLFGVWLFRVTKFALFHPLPVATAIVCGTLLLTGTSYEQYNIGGSYLSFILTPATVCLAVPLYENLPKIKKNAGVILLSLCAGCLTAIVSIWGFSRWFSLPDVLYFSAVPKSVTTAIAVELSDALGGLRAITVVALLLAGLIGTLAGPAICKLFGIRKPVAVGLAIGASSHVLGTTRALQIGPVEGAMSGLAVGVCGLITAVAAPVVVRLLGLLW